MVAFLKKYKSFLVGFVITIVIVKFLERISFIDLPKDDVIKHLLLYIFWWIVTSLIIHNLSYFKKNKIVVIKIMGLLLLLFLAEFADYSLNIPDNPITFPLLIVFWLGVFYVLLPKFFIKYRTPIIIMYGFIILYFLYIRLKDINALFNDDTIVGLVIVPVPILTLLWMYEQFKWMRLLKTEKANAELALLKSQINPHFFFNTLNNLYGLVVEKSDRAPEVILKLSDMMRYTIYDGKEDFVSLSDEINYLKNYIELHKIRYQKKVAICFNNSITKEYKIAPLLFIILLENAFKHGVEKLTEDAYIHIDLRSEENIIIFQIENNYETEKSPTKQGIGISNLKRRLDLIYPNNYELIMNSHENVYTASLKITII